MNDLGYTYLEVYLNDLVAHITEGQGYEAPPVSEYIDLFCGDVPTEIPVVLPEELSNLITDGALGTEDRTGKTDGCFSNNNFAWRTSDITFTLPANTVISANFASNGTRFVHLTLDEEPYGNTYNLKNGSCEPVFLDLNNAENAQLRIQSFGSDGTTYSQFSIPNLCIRQKIAMSVKTVKDDRTSQVIITRDEIIADAQSIEIYNVNGQLLKLQHHVSSIQITDLNKGVYIARIVLKDGSKENVKFVR
jgi:hypothetical protein